MMSGRRRRRESEKSCIKAIAPGQQSQKERDGGSNSLSCYNRITSLCGGFLGDWPETEARGHDQCKVDDLADLDIIIKWPDSLFIAAIAVGLFSQNGHPNPILREHKPKPPRQTATPVVVVVVVFTLQRNFCRL